MRQLEWLIQVALLSGFAGPGLGAVPSDGEMARTAPPVTALAFAPGGAELIAGSQAGIERRSWPDLEVVDRMETALEHVHDIAFSPDGLWIALAGGRPSENGGIELRGWPSGELVWSRVTRDDLVYSVVWSPDSRQVFASGHDARIVVRDAATGTTVRVLEGHSRPVLAACVTQDGATIVSAGIDQSLRVWNAATGERKRVLNNHTDVVRDLSLRPDSDPEALAMVASISDDGTMRLWQPTIGRLVRFTRLPAPPLAVEWTPDGMRVLVTSRDGRLFVVDPDTLEIATALTTLDDWVYSIAVPPTERAGAPDVAIAGSNGRIAALRVPTSAEEETR